MLKESVLLISSLMLFACASSSKSKPYKPYNACDQMYKTNDEISEIEEKNRGLSAKKDPLKDGDALKMEIEKQIAENENRIRYLTQSNQTNAENCKPQISIKEDRHQKPNP
jgi:hypothetical protein